MECKTKFVSAETNAGLSKAAFLNFGTLASAQMYQLINRSTVGSTQTRLCSIQSIWDFST